MTVALWLTIPATPGATCLHAWEQGDPSSPPTAYVEAHSAVEGFGAGAFYFSLCGLRSHYQARRVEHLPRGGSGGVASTCAECTRLLERRRKRDELQAVVDGGGRGASWARRALEALEI